MKFKDLRELKDSCEGILKTDNGKTVILDSAGLQGDFLDNLVYNAVFGVSPEIRGWARWLIKTAAIEYGTRPASIQNLYE